MWRGLRHRGVDPLVASLIWGVLLATRVLRPHDRPAWLLDLHRALGGLAVVATGLHLVSLVADSYITFGVMDLMVPFASQWKPGAVALGVIGAYLIVAIQVTSMAMRRLPRSAWRAVHLTSYALVWVVSLHAGLAGSDVKNRVYQFVALVLTLGAVTATTTRCSTAAVHAATPTPLERSQGRTHLRYRAVPACEMVQGAGRSGRISPPRPPARAALSLIAIRYRSPDGCPPLCWSCGATGLGG